MSEAWFRIRVELKFGMRLELQVLDEGLRWGWDNGYGWGMG